MKSISKPLITVSIILLLLGVSVTSAIRVENNKPIIESKEDCGCNVFSDTEIVRLETQLDKLESYTKLLLVLSKHNSELQVICEKISLEVSSLEKMVIRIVNFVDLLKELEVSVTFPILCLLFGIRVGVSWTIHFIAEYTEILNPEMTPFRIILSYIFFFRFWVYHSIGVIFGCWEQLGPDP